MPGLLLIYALCGISGVRIEGRLVLNSLLKRTVVVFAAAAAQLMLSVQILSLIKQLTRSGLLSANLLLTFVLFFVLARRSLPPGRLPWPTLLSCRFTELIAGLKDPLVMSLVGVSLAMFFTACVAGWCMIPFGDCYHLEMPLFWRQNHSILPFQVPNPRIVSLSFLNEALQLPGFLYVRSPVMAAIFTFLPGLLALGTVFSLARRIAAGFKASICAAAITAGYTRFALDPLYTAGEGFWAAAWFGGSLIFLLDAHPRASDRRSWVQDTACSVFCFTMACGAKNTTIVLAPLYLTILYFIIRARHVKQTTPPPSDLVAVTPMHARKGPLATPGPPGELSRTFLTLLGCGTAGLLCSGVIWNYVSNTIWFGNSRGPTLISHTVSSDFRPRAVWTRLCRGGVLMLYDTVWVPRTAQNGYVHLCQSTVKALGGQQVLREDDDYSSFKTKELTPRKGLGLLGIGFYLPGVALALSRLLSNDKKACTPSAGFNTAVLVFMTIGSFVMCHLILRWQPIGLLRLMCPFVIAGAPLSALLLEWRWLRVAALGLLAVSAAMFFVFWAGHVSRRMGWADRPSLKLIARLQNEHGMNVHYQWRGSPACEFQMHEDYTYREIFEKLLNGIRQPCTIGFVGNSNSECDFLFGRKFQNRVIPLLDSRSPTRILEPSSDLDYLVALDEFSAIRAWAEAHGFVELFTATDGERPMIIAFDKKSSALQSEAGAAVMHVPHSWFTVPE